MQGATEALLPRGPCMAEEDGRIVRIEGASLLKVKQRYGDISERQCKLALVLEERERVAACS